MSRSTKKCGKDNLVNSCVLGINFHENIYKSMLGEFSCVLSQMLVREISPAVGSQERVFNIKCHAFCMAGAAAVSHGG